VEQIFEIRSCIETLVTDIKIYTVFQYSQNEVGGLHFCVW